MSDINDSWTTFGLRDCLGTAKVKASISSCPPASRAIGFTSQRSLERTMATIAD